MILTWAGLRKSFRDPPPEEIIVSHRGAGAVEAIGCSGPDIEENVMQDGAVS